jgi:hypothetical protein
MVHSGYEASGVNYTFGSLKGLLQTAKAIFRGAYDDPAAERMLHEWKPEPHGPLVQIAQPATTVVVRTSAGEMTGVSGD